MAERLITAGRESRRPLAVLVVAMVLAALLVSLVPWSLRHPDLARTYISEQAETVFVLVGGAVVVMFITALLVQVLIGLGVLASAYGRSSRPGTTIATPWGRVGHPRQRLRLTAGTVTVRLVDGTPPSPMRRYGVQHVYFTQRGRTIHTMSSVRYAPGCRAHLIEWLEPRGITPVFEGDDGILPT